MRSQVLKATMQKSPSNSLQLWSSQLRKLKIIIITMMIIITIINLLLRINQKEENVNHHDYLTEIDPKSWSRGMGGLEVIHFKASFP